MLRIQCSSKWQKVFLAGVFAGSYSLTALAIPPDEQGVFTTFNEFPNPTAKFSVGSPANRAKFSGDAAAATLGIGELYVSFPRAWAIEPDGVAQIKFRRPAGDVSFFARTRSTATAPLVLTALDSKNHVIDRVELTSVITGFELVSFSGEISTIIVENMDDDPNHFASIDDFGFTTPPPGSKADVDEIDEFEDD